MFADIIIAITFIFSIIFLFFLSLSLLDLATGLWDVATNYWYFSLLFVIICICYIVGKKELERKNVINLKKELFSGCRHLLSPFAIS